MVRVLSIRFQQCFGVFMMLLVDGSSETGLFRHLSNHVFRIPLVQKSIGYQGHLFSQNVQNWIEISKMRQKIGKSFWDNCIWRFCIKLSLLRREYLSLTVNVLRNSAKILHLIKGDFFQLNSLHIDQLIWQRCCR